MIGLACAEVLLGILGNVSEDSRIRALGSTESLKGNSLFGGNSHEIAEERSPSKILLSINPFSVDNSCSLLLLQTETVLPIRRMVG
jgi:hypothetical protein